MSDYDRYHAITTRTARALRADLRLGQRLRRNSDGIQQGIEDQSPLGARPNMQWARVTSLTQMGDAYPGLLETQYNAADGTFADLDGITQVWISFPRGYTPTEDDVTSATPFLVRQDQNASWDGRMVFVAEDVEPPIPTTGGGALVDNWSLTATGNGFNDAAGNGFAWAPITYPTFGDITDYGELSAGVVVFDAMLPMQLNGQNGSGIEITATGLFQVNCTLINVSVTPNLYSGFGAPVAEFNAPGLTLELWEQGADYPFAAQTYDQSLINWLINELAANVPAVALAPGVVQGANNSLGATYLLTSPGPAPNLNLCCAGQIYCALPSRVIYPLLRCTNKVNGQSPIGQIVTLETAIFTGAFLQP
jgi:hypothetical protein